MNEKKQIEKATAEKYIELYNRKYDTTFKIKEWSDNPDVICENQTGDKLNLEITLTENNDGDIQALLGRSEHKSLKHAKEHGMGQASSLSGNVSEQAYNRIHEKMMKDYGVNVALVVRDTSPLDWNWNSEIKKLALRLKGVKNPFDKGIWILSPSQSQSKLFRVI